MYKGCQETSSLYFFKQLGLDIGICPCLRHLLCDNDFLNLTVKLLFKTPDLSKIQHSKRLLSIKIIRCGHRIHTYWLKIKLERSCLLIQFAFRGIQDRLSRFSVSAGNFECLSQLVLTEYIVSLCHRDNYRKLEECVICFLIKIY